MKVTELAMVIAAHHRNSRPDSAHYSRTDYNAVERTVMHYIRRGPGPCPPGPAWAWAGFDHGMCGPRGQRPMRSAVAVGRARNNMCQHAPRTGHHGRGSGPTQVSAIHDGPGFEHITGQTSRRSRHRGRGSGPALPARCTGTTCVGSAPSSAGLTI